VAFDLAEPAAFDDVLGDLLLASQPGSKARSVLARGEELRAAKVWGALARSLGGCTQVVAQFELGLEEVGPAPLQGVFADPAAE
jgi:hypothetical protein